MSKTSYSLGSKKLYETISSDMVTIDGWAVVFPIGIGVMEWRPL